MDAFDPERKIDLIVDEWGTWHPPTPGHNPAFLWQQNTVRDALVAALTLDIFNRHADKVKMANIAQTINVLQALILTDGAKMILTPTYHVYSLYADHQGGVAKRVEIEGGSVETVVLNQKRQVPVLSGSASSRDGRTILTVVNAHASEAVTACVRLFGGGVGKAFVSSLCYPQGDIWAHNVFDASEVVGLSEAVEVGVSGGELVYSFPAASITKFVFEEVA
jgi:alpha-N-arabinofuranosidase